jgi:hypothetical protein
LIDFDISIKCNATHKKMENMEHKAARKMMWQTADEVLPLLQMGFILSRLATVKYCELSAQHVRPEKCILQHLI